MDDSIEQQIRARAERAIEEKVFPGCVIGYLRQGGARTILPFGNYKYVKSSAVKERSIYDLASITKSIPLASLALTLIGEGKLLLEDSVRKYLPELQNDHDATIEDLLRYRVRGPRLSQLHLKALEEIRTHVLERGFDTPEGNGAYTNLPAFLLGMIIERVTGEILPALANRYFFEPLGMNDTSFFPTNPDTSISAGRQILMCSHNTVAPTEIVDGVEIRGIVHDESARSFARARRAVGHAGLFSTVPDMLDFVEAMLGGKLPLVVEGAQRGLGWEGNREWMGSFSSRSGLAVFGKTGFTGTSILCDIERKIGLVILSNRTYPHRPRDNSAINAFRKDIADIVFG